MVNPLVFCSIAVVVDDESRPVPDIETAQKVASKAGLGTVEAEDAVNGLYNVGFTPPLVTQLESRGYFEAEVTLDGLTYRIDAEMP
jgi:hypothetical protein